MGIPIHHPPPIEPKQPHHEDFKTKAQGFQAVHNPDDPWEKMFSAYGATPEEIQKFKDGILNTINTQMNHDRDRMIKALKKLKTGEDS